MRFVKRFGRALLPDIRRYVSILLVGAIIGVSGPSDMLACTAFVLQSGDRTLLCEGFDWHSGEGLVAFTQAGVGKKSILAEATGEPPFKWTSRHASVTFSWIGLSMPTCGMNTAGLAVTALIDNQAVFKKRPGQPQISISQWKQYILDNCATVAEALATLDRLSITTLSQYGVHYLLADAGGDRAAIQFRDGSPRVYQKTSLPNAVLTDSLDLGVPLPKADDKTDTRFHRAARMAQTARRSPPEALEGIAWETFDQVRIHGYTRWNILFDLTACQVHFKTDSHEPVRHIDLGTWAKINSAPFHLLDINAPLTGDVNDAFQSEDARLLRRVLAAADQVVTFTPAAYEALNDYAEYLRFVE